MPTHPHPGPTDNPEATGVDLAPGEHLFPEPTTPVTPRFVWTYIIAQLVFFVALLGPATVGIAVKVDQIADESSRSQVLGAALALGAIGAVISNVLFGRLSDRTTGRWGRRRPWLVGGTVVMTFAFFVIAVAPNGWLVAVGWLIAQLGANATLAPFMATLADQVPRVQRGSVAALLGMAQNAGILGGTFVAERFQDQMVLLFVGPSVLAIVAMAVYAWVLPDQVLTRNATPLDLKTLVLSFWVSPREHPDFILAWVSRFLIILATFMFTTFRLYFIEDRAGVSDNPAAAVTIGVLIYTVALLLSAYVAGRLSDRFQRRKLPVALSTALYAVGTIMLVQVSDVSHFYLIEALLGFAYGIYIGVDLALVTDVLPNPDDSGKDLGIFNMANALPQSLAPALGGILLAVGSADNQNYDLLLYTAGAAALLGALVIIPIKGVK